MKPDTKTAHTPGPWRFHERAQRIYGGRTGGIKIVQMGCSPEWKADARLIAAAPDLLAALEDARSRLAAMSISRAGEAENKEAGLRVIDAAIARATGAAK